MAHQQHFLTQMADELRGQLQDDARKLGAGILGSGQPDGHRVPRDQMLAYVRSSWQDPKFRHGLLQQFGAKQFLDIANAAMAPAIEEWTRHEAEQQQERLAQVVAGGGQPMKPQLQAPPQQPAPGPAPMAMPVASGPWAAPGMGGA